MKLSSRDWYVGVEDTEAAEAGWGLRMSWFGKELFLNGSGASRKEEPMLSSLTTKDDVKIQGRPPRVLVTL